MQGEDAVTGTHRVESLDRRRHAYRDDLAAQQLRGLIDAPRYAEGRVRQVARSVAPLRTVSGSEKGTPVNAGRL